MMLSFICLSPLCARKWMESVGFQQKLPPEKRDRCPYCNHKGVAEAVRR